MATTVSLKVYDNSTLVPVIASFDNEGHIRPLYVRIDGDAYKIHTSWLKPGFARTSVFQCQLIDNGQLKPLILTYYHQENVWTIPKG